jgi:hypothetical protein
MALKSLIMSHHCLRKHESNVLFLKALTCLGNELLHLVYNFPTISSTYANLNMGFGADNSLKAAFTSLSCLKTHFKITK